MQLLVMLLVWCPQADWWVWSWCDGNLIGVMLRC